MEMRFELDCPHCGNPLRIPVQYLGQRGRCVKCKNLIDTDVDMRLPIRSTLLHQAARSGDAVLVRFLLARGADPNARDDGVIRWSMTCMRTRISGLSAPSTEKWSTGTTAHGPCYRENFPDTGIPSIRPEGQVKENQNEKRNRPLYAPPSPVCGARRAGIATN